ncbi:hypothetical protein IMZ48_44085 [Candidatus Bathyarchaeota archaeon]|nr:hypothetical protein [Candidatus Bathyarchaeota archaeon]
MPRFPVAFGKRKSSAPKDDGEVVPSFRVLERTTDATGVKSFDGSRGVSRPMSTVRPYSQVDYLAEEENMFAGLKVNRYVDYPYAVYSSRFVVVWRVRKFFLGPVLGSILHTLRLRRPPPSTTALDFTPHIPYKDVSLSGHLP